MDNNLKFHIVEFSFNSETYSTFVSQLVTPRKIHANKQGDYLSIITPYGYRLTFYRYNPDRIYVFTTSIGKIREGQTVSLSVINRETMSKVALMNLTQQLKYLYELVKGQFE